MHLLHLLRIMIQRRTVFLTQRHKATKTLAILIVSLCLCAFVWDNCCQAPARRHDRPLHLLHLLRIMIQRRTAFLTQRHKVTKTLTILIVSLCLCASVWNNCCQARTYCHGRPTFLCGWSMHDGCLSGFVCNWRAGFYRDDPSNGCCSQIGNVILQKYPVCGKILLIR